MGLFDWVVLLGVATVALVGLAAARPKGRLRTALRVGAVAAGCLLAAVVGIGLLLLLFLARGFGP